MGALEATTAESQLVRNEQARMAERLAALKQKQREAAAASSPESSLDSSLGSSLGGSSSSGL